MTACAPHDPHSIELFCLRNTSPQFFTFDLTTFTVFSDPAILPQYQSSIESIRENDLIVRM